MLTRTASRAGTAPNSDPPVSGRLDAHIGLRSCMAAFDNPLHLRICPLRDRALVFFLSCGTQGKWEYSARSGARWQRQLLRPRAQLRASVQFLVHSNKKFRGQRGREWMATRGEERVGGDDRDQTLKNMRVLMPAAKFRCWRQNLSW
jgi:hypothetical protein